MCFLDFDTKFIKNFLVRLISVSGRISVSIEKFASVDFNLIGYGNKLLVISTKIAIFSKFFEITLKISTRVGFEPRIFGNR